MAITSTTNRISYTGNGSQTAFTFPYIYYDQTQLLVYVDGVLQTLASTYTVSPTTANPEDGNVGGTVTFLAAPANGAAIQIIRSLVIAQTVVLNDGSNFPAKTIEKDFDQIVMMLQQHDETLTRSLRATINESLDMQLPAVASRKNSYLAFDSAGLPIASPSPSITGTTVLSSGSTTSRTLAERFAEGINVKDYGAIGDGVADDTAALEAALTAAAVSGGTVYAPAGTYAYATSPNFARAGVNIVADRDAVFKHTGTGNAFTLDGGAAGGGIFGLRFDNICVEGNSNSTHGMYVRSVHHAQFIHPRVKGCATTGAAIQIEWCVANEWQSPRVSVNEGAFSSKPLYGMYLTRRGAGGDWTTTQTITNPVMEGIDATGGAGIYIDYAGNNTITCGTSESNYNGLYISSNGSGQNTVVGTNFEANTNRAVHLAGTASNILIGIYANDGHVELSAGSHRNIFVGGVVDALTLDGTGQYNIVLGTRVLGTTTDGNPTRNAYFASTNPGSTGAVTTTARVLSGFSQHLSTVTYAATMSPDASDGGIFKITATNGTAFTINVPSNALAGQSVKFIIRNTSGGALGVATWNGYKMGAAWTQPANGFSRSIEFYYDGTNWIEVGRTAADVAN